MCINQFTELENGRVQIGFSLPFLMLILTIYTPYHSTLIYNNASKEYFKKGVLKDWKGKFLFLLITGSNSSLFHVLVYILKFLMTNSNPVFFRSAC